MSRDSEGMEKFNLELKWCLDKLEQGLQYTNDSKKANAMMKTYKILSNPKHPMIKKRQLMKSIFGDYRKIMAREAASSKQGVPKLEENSHPPRASVFFKKSCLSLSEAEADQASSNLENLGFENLKLQDEGNFQFNFSVPGNNN